MYLDRILTLVSNLIPLAGVWWWGWDVFQILILFWMQTVLVAAFTLAHIHKLPAAALGNITFNGVERPATHRDLLLLIGAVGTVFCTAHLLFLWVIFSGDWSRRIHGPVSFWQQMVIASGAWMPLLFAFVAGVIGYVLAPPRPAFARRFGARIGFADDGRHPEDLGGLLLAMFKRIVLMQVAIIFGGMLANSYGTMAPLMILIGLKALFDLGANKPLTGGSTAVEFKP